MSKKWKIIFASLVLVAVVFRIALPVYMLKKANAFLADYSKVVSAHIGDIDISFIRMAYRFENIEVKIRKDNFEILKVDSVDVSLAWRELLRLRILTDIEVRDAKVQIDPDVMPALAAVSAENAKKSAEEAEAKGEDVKTAAGGAEDKSTVQSKLFPLRIERIVIAESSLMYAAEKNSPVEKRLTFDQTQIRISNVNPIKKDGRTVATFASRLMKAAKLKGVAQARMNADQERDWDIDAEMRGFNLAQANPFLIELVPFTFTEGTLDMFAEVKSERGALIGYVKPFLSNVDVIARKEKFIGAKHFFAEMGVALTNVILQRRELKSLATKVDFSKAGPGAELKVDTLGAVANAIEHRIDRPIAPSVEDEIKLK